MDSPSWSDAVHAAIGSCLPCFGQSHDSDHESSQNSRRPPQHLESLLADVPDTDTEAETVSLHSNVGAGQRRAKKKRPQKRITFFGFNLFGRSPEGAIHLPEDADEVDRLLHRSSRRRHSNISTGTAASGMTRSSSLTFDSDASPLDPAAIDQLTPAALEERARQVELQAAEERRAKEERRRLRREKKEMKRLAAQLASGVEDSGEFEGFQGSGSGLSPSVPGYPYIPPPLMASPVGSAVGAQSMDDDGDGSADLDGTLYTGRSRTSGASVSGGNSDSQRSPASVVSYNDRPHQSHHLNLTPSTEPTTKKKKSSSSKSKSTKSHSSATSSTQSPSLASPVGSEFTGLPSPSPLREDFSKKPALTMTTDLLATEDRGFPSPGLGGVPRLSRSGAGGAFLASRGDDGM
ncbi:hypothetical protein Moror_4731 [Moniliophthora roreri MCA 2997]|uniref:Uncharacterized protein n=2 Tax=Moniliophthora roreri TaxID=221103 RepID=V2YKJ0_MONRO|nr:hypothetical protein Moror_4731 [Moniliophthora roreri MCA 2997]KAI3616007.1 hypothetical protein WG66_010383 [Moniliophthora roreri]